MRGSSFSFEGGGKVHDHTRVENRVTGGEGYRDSLVFLLQPGPGGCLLRDNFQGRVNGVYESRGGHHLSFRPTVLLSAPADIGVVQTYHPTRVRRISIRYFIPMVDALLPSDCPPTPSFLPSHFFLPILVYLPQGTVSTAGVGVAPHLPGAGDRLRRQGSAVAGK